MTRWHVYLVRCGDGALYTGIATDVDRRLAEHQEGKGAKSLRGKRPLQLVLAREIGDRALAMRVEHRIKKLPKARKERLVEERGAIEQLVAGARRVAGDPHPDPPYHPEE